MTTVAIPPVPGTDPPGAPLPPGERGVVPGLLNPRPLATQLPALMQEDDFCVRMTEALDDVVAPAYSVLDCLTAYLDPDLTPPDFLDWLASWVGVEVDENWSVGRRRAFLHRVVDLYRIRGTAAGLREHVESYAGVAPEVLENGGCLWSQTAGTPLPGSADPFVTVRLTVADPAAVSRRTVERIVESARPAHLAASVEILTGSGRVVERTDDRSDGNGSAKNAPGAVDLPGSERIDMAAPGPEAPDGQDVEMGQEPEAPLGKEPSA